MNFQTPSKRISGVSFPEMDAAKALLELHAGADSRNSTSDVADHQPSDLSSDQLLLATKVTTSKYKPMIKLKNGGGVGRNNQGSLKLKNKKNSPNLHLKHLQEQRIWAKESKLLKKKATAIREEKKTQEAETQTQIEYQLPEILEASNYINTIFHMLQILDKNLKIIGSLVQASKSPPDEKSINNSKDISDQTMDDSVQSKKTLQLKMDLSTNTSTLVKDDEEHKTEEEADEEMSDEGSFSDDEPIINVRRSTGSEDMTRIGESDAYVPSRLFKLIDWTSYTSATRKLLSAIFSRRILATHSLSGKRSPAFPDKPAKKQLDPTIVNGIVKIVSERCNVRQSLVRTCITTKCADESKMYRTRVVNKKKFRLSKKENIPPSSTSNNDS